MNKPIVDLEVLNREYAVEGYEWVPDTFDWTGDESWPFRMREDEDHDVGTVGHARAQVACGCAYLGVPTPWGMAKRLRDRVEMLRDEVRSQALSGYYDQDSAERMRDQVDILEGIADELEGK